MTRPYRRLTALLVLLLGVVPVSGAAATLAWRATGPGSGDVRALAVAPGDSATVYVGTTDGVMRSTDAGRTWAPAGLISNTVTAVAVSPDDRQAVYAAVQYDGVHKTVDGGATWARVSGYSARALAVCPSDAQTVYMTGSSGVYRSTDGGFSWAVVTPPTDYYSGPWQALLLSETDPRHVFAASEWAGVFFSSDGGANWSAVSNGLNGVVNCLAACAGAPKTMYAGTSSNGVYRTTNGGATWVAANAGMAEASVTALWVSPTDSAAVYAGVVGSGVLKSTDGGRTWLAVNAGLTSLSVGALAAAAGDPPRLYAGSAGQGVFVTTDGGNRWANACLSSLSVQAIASPPSEPSTVYAGTYGHGVYRSTDAGANWAPASTGLSSTYVWSLACSPTDTATAYAGTWAGVFVTVDAGRHWSAAGLVSSGVYAVAVAPSSPQVVYAGTGSSGVFRSANGGLSWAAANTGYTGTFIYSLAVSPTNPQRVYAGTSNGVLVTGNGGSSWSAGGLAGLSVRGIVISPSAPQTIYAATDGGARKSIDGGSTWTAINTGLPSTNIWALGVSPTEPEVLVAGLYANGVYESSDGGATWSIAHTGMPAVSIASVAITAATPRVVVAGTESLGAYVLATQPNAVPRADAGADQTVLADSSVNLDGTRSSDADGDSLRYHWRAQVGIALSDSTAARPSFIAPTVPGAYVIDLRVGDGTVLSVPDTVVVTVAPPPPPLWTVSLEVASGQQPPVTLRFGLAPTATDGRDNALGEEPLPPVPPDSAFDARWTSLTTVALDTDYRGAGAATSGATWDLTIQAGPAAVPVSITWDSVSLPGDGWFTLVDKATGGSAVNLDMRVGDRLTLAAPGITMLQVRYEATVAVSHQAGFGRGWNLVSLPCALSDSTVATLLPGAQSLFAWNGGYEEHAAFSSGEGYWVRLPDSTRFAVTGQAYPPSALNHVRPAEWSLVGPGHRALDVAALRQAYPTLVSVFGYAAGYRRPTRLEPGRAYWMYFSTPTALDLSGRVAPATSARPVANAPAAAEAVLWVEGPQGSQALQLGVAAQDVEPLPPVPPADVFDVRVELAAGLAAWQVPADSQPHAVRIQGGVTQVRWEGIDNGGWQLSVDGALHPLTGTGRAPVSTGSRVELSKTTALPRQTALETIYPNPFNPATTVTYSLAVTARVELRVFSVTGQWVRTLVSGTQPAGRYAASWDGRDGIATAVAAGVYLCELKVGDWRAVRRIVLVK